MPNINEKIYDIALLLINRNKINLSGRTSDRAIGFLNQKFRNKLNPHMINMGGEVTILHLLSLSIQSRYIDKGVMTKDTCGSNDISQSNNSILVLSGIESSIDGNGHSPSFDIVDGIDEEIITVSKGASNQTK